MKLGYSADRVSALLGGLEAWHDAGYPMEYGEPDSE